MNRMLQFVIVSSKIRDISGEAASGGTGSATTGDTGVRDLNARSLALSALLGTHPPALPTRALVALAELFGIAGGTMRTALSRMAAAGDVESADGWHRLTGRLVDRQRAQDIGRRPPTDSWDGRWHTVIAAADQRDLAERRRFRSALSDHRFGELRPDIWMRPANLPAPDLGDGSGGGAGRDGGGGAIVVTGTIERREEHALVDRLWDLPGVADRASRLAAAVAELRSTVDVTRHDSIPPTFTLAAAVLRFLRAEPLLPPVLTPPDWPVDGLRTVYVALERDLQATLRDFLRGHRA